MSDVDSIRDKYVEQYSLYHSDKAKYPGHSFRNGDRHITQLIEETGAKTVLDYGCGKATQYTEKKMHLKWGIGMPALYDPAVPQYSELPNQMFDGIYSTDVMEHIPEEVIPSVFEWLFSHAKKFVFLGIATSPAVAILPNGENAHCTVKPVQWWVEQIKQHTPVYTHLKCYGNYSGYVVLNNGSE